MKIVAYALLCLLCVNSIPAIGMKKKEKKVERVELVENEVVESVFSVFHKEKLVEENLDCLTHVLNVQHERNRKCGKEKRMNLVSAQELINTLEGFEKNEEDLKSAGDFLTAVRKVLRHYCKGSQFYFSECKKVCEQSIQKKKCEKTGKFIGGSEDAKHYIHPPRAKGADPRADVERVYFREKSANDPVYSVRMQEKKDGVDYIKVVRLLKNLENRLVKKD